MPSLNLFQNFKVSLFSFLFLSLLGCQTDRLDVDVSDVQIDLNFERLDLEMSETSLSEITEKHFELADSYGELYQAFIEIMLKQGPVYDMQTAAGIKQFMANTDIQSVHSEIQSIFPKKEFKTKEFESAFKHYKYYFPEDTIPQIIGYYSNFNAKSLLFGNNLAVGLDMYLGTDNEIVKRIPVSSLPQYFKNKMDADFLVSDAMKIFLLNKHYKDMGEDFLSTIISLGKIMYLLDACMPETENWKKIGYSKEELKWTEENEGEIWTYIINEKLLFSVEQDKINNFINEGPNTKGLPPKSPSRVGVWIGWQMVRDYMNQNKTISIQEMINETDSKKILKHYKP